MYNSNVEFIFPDRTAYSSYILPAKFIIIAKISESYGFVTLFTELLKKKKKIVSKWNYHLKTSNSNP